MYQPIITPQLEEAIKQGAYFDLAPALKVQKFIETCCIQSKHPFNGQPLKLLPWQLDEIIYPLYGWMNADGSRLFNRLICFIPKKQGKTTLISALSIYHLIEYPGSNCCCIAGDRKQAGVLFGQAADFCELYEPLSKKLWVRRHISTIEDQGNKSDFKVLSSEKTGKQGYNLNFLALDEICEWSANGARIIWDAVKHSGMARKNAMQFIISTAQYDKSHIGYELFQKAQEIKAGRDKDIHTLPVIYSLPEEDDWHDENNWWKVNPSVGLTVPKEYYRNAYAEIKNMPNEEASFRTTLLNQWIGHSQNWLSHSLWAGIGQQFNEEDLYGLPAIIGCDYARKYDLSAYSILVPKDDKFYLLCRFFIPKQLADQKQKKDPSAQYKQWNKQGWIEYTEGDVIDPSKIRESIARDAELFNIQEVRYDPWGFEESRQLLEQDGFNCIEVSQSYKGMAQATAHFERLVIEKKLIHNNNPILDWCVGNCTIKTSPNSEEIMVDKMRSNGRIDGAVASIIATTGILTEADTGGAWAGSWAAGW